MIYEYECSKCGTVQEKDHKMSEMNTEPCEQCGADPEELHKVISKSHKHFTWGKWAV